MLNNEPTGSARMGQDLLTVLTEEPQSNGHAPENGRDQREAGMIARLMALCGGRSAAAVAALTQTHPETARRYLSGKSTPHPVFLAAICDALGVSEAWLLCGRGEPYRDGGPHRVHVTPREAAVAVRTTLRELMTRMTSLERMLEYPRLKPASRSDTPGLIGARPIGGNGSYETTMADGALSEPGRTSPAPVRAFRLRHRA